MSRKKKRFAAISRRSAAGGALALLVTGGGATELAAQNAPAAAGTEKQAMTQGKFYCNSKALGPVERAHHKQLTDKLMAARREIVETPNGYEFQYNPSSVTFDELAGWVAAEGKCCPFFDFHIDLEHQG